MVLTAGYNLYDGILELFDTSNNTTQTISTLRLSYNEEDKIINLFADIGKKCRQNIYLLCITLGRNYKNGFRKNFITVANASKIPLIKIIGRKTSLLYGALTNFSKYLEMENVIWIFDIHETLIFCYIWEMRKSDKWRLKGCLKHEKIIKSFLKLYKSADLKEIRTKLPTPFKNPFIFVFVQQDNDIRKWDKWKFEKVFSSYKKIEFLNLYKWSTWASQYAANLVNKNATSIYHSEITLERNITIVVDDMKIFEIGSMESLPAETCIKIPIERDSVQLVVSEDNTNAKTMIFGAAGIFEIKLIIDDNGIFDIYIKSCQDPEKLTDIKSLISSVQEATIKEMTKTCYAMPPKNIGFNPNSVAVGIDFGTTECCVAVIRSSGPDCVALDLVTGLRTLPSYIGYDEAEPKCGQIVINRIRHYEKCTVFDAKRLLGKNFDEIPIDPFWPFSVTKTPENGCLIKLETPKGIINLSPEDVCSSVLKHIKIEVDKYQNKSLAEAVIAIPSDFTEKQKHALSRSAILAGWKTVNYIEEPIAAAFAYSNEMNIPNNSKLLLFDFGGGTMDVCIINVLENHCQVLSFDGNYYLGGRDFDAILYNHFDGILKHLYNIDVVKINKKWFLLQKCQEIKHTLSVTEKFWLDVTDFDSENNEQINITRQEFESMAIQRRNRITNVILRALNKAKLQRDEINFVVQVGGGSRMPLFKNLLKEIFPASIHKCCEKPDWIIAQGTALYAYCREYELKAFEKRD